VKDGVALDRQRLTSSEEVDISVLPRDKLPKHHWDKSVCCLIKVQIKPCLVLSRETIGFETMTASSVDVVTRVWPLEHGRW
jgi:hypothetical protein